MSLHYLEIVMTKLQLRGITVAEDTGYSTVCSKQFTGDIVTIVPYC